MATKKKVQEAPETIEEKPVKKTAKKTAKAMPEEKPVKKTAKKTAKAMPEEKPVKKTAKKTAKAMPEEKPEAVYIYHTGDNISEIAKVLTGKSYMEYAVLNYSGTNMDQLKDGDVLKWGL